MVLDHQQFLLQHSPDSPMAGVVSTAERVSETDANALVIGEPGVGKAALALHIHRQSRRSGKAFTQIRCEGASDEALGRALFGDACDLSYRGGLFGAAQGGTLLLEEIGELSLELQARLMNALATTGSADPLIAGRSVRVIATTSRPLQAIVARRRFRRDLIDLLAIPLVVPPLRIRLEDAVMIADACWQHVRPGCPIGADAIAVVMSHVWPGNVRELEAFVLRLATSCADGTVNRHDAERLIDLDPAAAVEKPSPSAVGEATMDLPCLEPDELVRQVQARGMSGLVDWIEGSIIKWALGRTRGSRKGAAELLGMKRTTLVAKLRRRADRNVEPDQKSGSTRWTPLLVVQ